MPVLTSFEELVSVGVGRTVKLSPGSLAVLLSALDLIGVEYQWTGTADDGSLTVEEKDRVDSYVDTATYELMRVARMKEIGDIFARFVSTPPDGALAMNGIPRLQADYPDLMPQIPTIWKTGNYFTLPNMATRGLFGAFALTELNAPVGTTFGEVFHTLTTDEIPSHAHQQNNRNGVGLVLDNANSGSGTGPVDGVAGAPNLPLMTGNMGGGQPHNNMPPGLACYWFIQAE